MFFVPLNESHFTRSEFSWKVVVPGAGQRPDAPAHGRRRCSVVSEAPSEMAQGEGGQYFPAPLDAMNS